MSFCMNCGQEVKDGTRFCTNCGSEIVPQTKPENNEEKTRYDGKIRKCPNCGEVINSFTVHCPSCGYELRDSSAADSVQGLYSELHSAESVEQKTLAIRNYPIPNAKEDIVEFMILTSSNISGEADKNIFEAWVAKFEQVYQKAQMTLQNDPAFTQIQKIYKKTKKNIVLEKILHTMAEIRNIITGYFKAMPNPVFTIVLVLLVIFNLILLFRGQFTGIAIILDVIILKVAYDITAKKGKKTNPENAALTAAQEADVPKADAPEVNVSKADMQEVNVPKAVVPETGVPKVADVCKVKIPSAVLNGISENYAVIENLFVQAGFTNVRTIPLNDLTFGIMNKPGTIDDITINGKELPRFKRKFDSDAFVVITYHSLRK